MHKAVGHLFLRLQVHAGILPDSRMRTAPRLHPDNTIRRQKTMLREELGVFLRINIVGDHPVTILLRQYPAQPLDQRRLTGPHPPANPTLYIVSFLHHFIFSFLLPPYHSPSSPQLAPPS